MNVQQWLLCGETPYKCGTKLFYTHFFLAVHSYRYLEKKTKNNNNTYPFSIVLVLMRVWDFSHLTLDEMQGIHWTGSTESKNIRTANNSHLWTI